MKPEVDMKNAFRLRPIMKQGTAASMPGVWTHYESMDAAHEGAKQMYHDDRVLRVMLVVDGAGTFLEWV